MKTRGWVGAILTVALAALAAGLPAAVGEEKKSEWVQLFDGKTLKGWKVFPEGTGEWKVEDGAIAGSGPASHLFSERGDYENFHYRVEAKIADKSNSGQYFRTKFMKGFPNGYEAQINATHTDRIRTGSLYPVFAKLSDADKKKLLVMDTAPHKPDEWFTQEVIADGNHIIIKVNDKTTVDFVDESKAYTKGHFAIQQHDTKSRLWVRKVEVKELPASK
jgi:hypothetical protein